MGGREIYKERILRYSRFKNVINLFALSYFFKFNEIKKQKEDIAETGKIYSFSEKEKKKRKTVLNFREEPVREKGRKDRWMNPCV